MESGNEDRHVLKLSGTAESPQPLKIGHNLHVLIEGSITKHTLSDNEDGSFTHTYKFNPVRIAMLNEKGETVKMKDTRSNSQLFRSILWKKWSNSSAQLDMDFDTWYDMVYKSMMFHAQEIVDMAEKEQKRA